MFTIAEVLGSYRLEIPTGSVTTLAAGDRMLSLRHTNANIAIRLKSLEAEFLLTTAFTAAQEVGFHAVIGRAYTVSPSGQTAVAIGADARKRASFPNTALGSGDVRVSNAGAITAGTVTEDTNPFARGSFWAGAVGAQLGPRHFDFTERDPGEQQDPGGLILLANEGILIKNTILMGAAGVGRWIFTLDFEDVILAS